MNKGIEKNLQKEVNNLIIDNQIQVYVSSAKKEKETYVKFKKAYGVLRIELGKINIIFKTEDLKQILGDEKIGKIE